VPSAGPWRRQCRRQCRFPEANGGGWGRQMTAACFVLCAVVEQSGSARRSFRSTAGSSGPRRRPSRRRSGGAGGGSRTSTRKVELSEYGTIHGRLSGSAAPRATGPLFLSLPIHACTRSIVRNIRFREWRRFNRLPLFPVRGRSHTGRGRLVLRNFITTSSATSRGLRSIRSRS
jgi:hypothetical protein